MQSQRRHFYKRCSDLSICDLAEEFQMKPITFSRNILFPFYRISGNGRGRFLPFPLTFFQASSARALSISLFLSWFPARANAQASSALVQRWLPWVPSFAVFQADSRQNRALRITGCCKDKEVLVSDQDKRMMEQDLSWVLTDRCHSWFSASQVDTPISTIFKLKKNLKSLNFVVKS